MTSALGPGDTEGGSHCNWPDRGWNGQSEVDEFIVLGLEKCVHSSFLHLLSKGIPCWCVSRSGAGPIARSQSYTSCLVIAARLAQHGIVAAIVTDDEMCV